MNLPPTRPIAISRVLGVFSDGLTDGPTDRQIDGRSLRIYFDDATLLRLEEN